MIKFSLITSLILLMGTCFALEESAELSEEICKSYITKIKRMDNILNILIDGVPMNREQEQRVRFLINQILDIDD